MDDPHLHRGWSAPFVTHRHLHRRIPLLLFLLLLLLSSVTAQPAMNPDDPSTWTLPPIDVVSLSPDLVLALPSLPLTLLYLALPLPNSSSLFAPAPSNTSLPSPLPTPVSPPTTASAFLALYSSATNASDPSYLTTSLLAGGSLPPSPSPLALDLPLPPSSSLSLYFLLTSPSSPSLTSNPLTCPNTSALTLPSQCIPPPSDLSFCPQLPLSLLLPSSINPYPLDAVAAALYAADLSLYQPGLDCSLQQPNASLCNNCLAIRQRWRCAQQFGGCAGGQPAGGPCQWLCREKNSRCGETEDCSVYPTDNCNGAGGRTLGWGWVVAVIAGLLCAA